MSREIQYREAILRQARMVEQFTIGSFATRSKATWITRLLGIWRTRAALTDRGTHSQNEYEWEGGGVEGARIGLRLEMGDPGMNSGSRPSKYGSQREDEIFGRFFGLIVNRRDTKLIPAFPTTVLK
jgi:hypothetical protein